MIWQRLVNLAHAIEVSAVATGGAIGGDTFIDAAARRLWPRAFHRLVLPKVPGNLELVEQWEWGLNDGRWRGEIIWTHLEPLKRNDVILDYGDRLEAFPLTDKEQWRRSGTWATWRWAGKRGMPRCLTPLHQM